MSTETKVFLFAMTVLAITGYLLVKYGLPAVF